MSPALWDAIEWVTKNCDDADLVEKCKVILEKPALIDRLSPEDAVKLGAQIALHDRIGRHRA